MIILDTDHTLLSANLRDFEQVPGLRVARGCLANSPGVTSTSDSSRVFSLPTDAEWEYACRAGATTKWSWGDDAAQLGEYAVWAGNSQRGSSAVGQKKPNAWGLYDMHGNVWEWYADWCAADYYGRSPARDPAGPPAPGSPQGREPSPVFRGGSAST